MELAGRMQGLQGSPLKLQLEAKLDFLEHLKWHCTPVLGSLSCSLSPSSKRRNFSFSSCFFSDISVRLVTSSDTVNSSMFLKNLNVLF